MAERIRFTPSDKFIVDQAAIDTFLTGKSDLLPCPFCGCKHVVLVGRIAESGNLVFTVMCTKGVFQCGAQMFTCVGNNEKEIADGTKLLTERWNNRTSI